MLWTLAPLSSSSCQPMTGQLSKYSVSRQSSLGSVQVDSGGAVHLAVCPWSSSSSGIDFGVGSILQLNASFQLLNTFTLPSLDCSAGSALALDSAHTIYVYGRTGGEILKVSSAGVTLSLCSGRSSDLYGDGSITVDGVGRCMWGCGNRMCW